MQIYADQVTPVRVTKARRARQVEAVTKQTPVRQSLKTGSLAYFPPVSGDQSVPVSPRAPV